MDKEIFSDMDENELKAALACMLFVAGEPVLKCELARTLELTALELDSLLKSVEREQTDSACGLIMEVTEDSVQLVSNKKYSRYVELLLQPPKEKNISQSLMETLSVVAYYQPTTRGEIESVRGVRCEYAVRELLKQGLIDECGRKQVLGRPMMFKTTDKFLRLFGLTSINDLPEFSRFCSQDSAEDEPSDFPPHLEDSQL